MMQRLDTNSDGSISQEEAAAEDRMKNSFGDYDSNKDGKVVHRRLLLRILLSRFGSSRRNPLAGDSHERIVHWIGYRLRGYCQRSIRSAQSDRNLRMHS
jgi:hypothetical protein